MKDMIAKSEPTTKMGWDGSVTQCAVLAFTGRGRGGSGGPLIPTLLRPSYILHLQHTM